MTKSSKNESDTDGTIDQEKGWSNAKLKPYTSPIRRTEVPRLSSYASGMCSDAVHGTWPAVGTVAVGRIRTVNGPSSPDTARLGKRPAAAGRPGTASGEGAAGRSAAADTCAVAGLTPAEVGLVPCATGGTAGRSCWRRSC